MLITVEQHDFNLFKNITVFFLNVDYNKIKKVDGHICLDDFVHRICIPVNMRWQWT